MDQGVTVTFKSYYLQKMFVQLDTADSENQFSVKDFWMNFNIKKQLTTLEMHGQKCHSLA
jgi:hypothetical protein